MFQYIASLSGNQGCAAMNFLHALRTRNTTLKIGDMYDCLYDLKRLDALAVFHNKFESASYDHASTICV